MVNKQRLGKGLSALIPDFSESDEYRTDKFSEIRVTEISSNPFQPREEFDPELLDELKQSIAEKGIIQPITVRHYGGKYQLISGERRLRAVRELGFGRIPAYVLKIERDEELLELALIENIQREDLNPVDEAKGYERLIKECNLTQEQVAQKVGKDRSSVTNFLRLLKLPLEIQKSLKNGEVSMGHARALLAVDDLRQQIKLWKLVVKRNYSVRKVEELVKSASSERASLPPNTKPRKSALILDVEDKLREILGTQLRIYPKKEGGKIEIEYYSDEDLDRIFSILTSTEKQY